MYTSMSEAADEQRQAAIEEGKNLDVAQDLRDVADWLEQHPELPKVAWAHVWFSPLLALPRISARELLSMVAGALGGRAEERLQYGRVEITGKFGGVRVVAEATPTELGAVQPATIEYERILAPAPEVDLPISTEELIAEAER